MHYVTIKWGSKSYDDTQPTEGEGVERVSTSKSEGSLTPAQIAALQAAMGLSLSQFAVSLGVSRDCVVKWRGGRAKPRWHKPVRRLRRLMKEWGIE